MRLRFIPTGSLSPFYAVIDTPHQVYVDAFTEWAKVLLGEYHTKNGRIFWRIRLTTKWFRELNDALLFVRVVEGMEESPYAMGWSL